MPKIKHLAPDYSNTGKRWSIQEDKVLFFHLFKSKQNPEDAADALFGKDIRRTHSAVKHRAKAYHRLITTGIINHLIESHEFHHRQKQA